MREKTKWIMLITAAAFVGLMVFEWGMDLSGQTSAQLRGGELGRVNGQVITYEEFATLHRNLIEQYQREQDEPISPIQSRDLEDLAWEQLITDRLLQQELRRRGLRATPAEVRQAARFMPPPEFYQSELFHTDGQFDLAKYHEYLSSPAVDPQLLMQLESYYRDVIPRNKLIQQVMSGLYLTDGELWRMWRDMTERAEVRYLRLDPDRLVPDDAVTVTDQEINAYYRANREEFRRPAHAAVRIMVLNREPSAADTAAVRDRIEALRREILAGADFGEVAARESEDPGSASQGGSLGTFSRGDIIPAVDDAVFSLAVGQVSEPVLSEFGYHLIRVDSRDGDQASAHHILLRITPSEEGLDALYLRADSLELVGEREGFDAAARRFNLSTSTADLVEDMPFLPEIGRMDEGLDWALWEARPGDVSPVFETGTSFYMLELVDVTPAGVIPLEEARPTIESQLRFRKKMEETKQLASQLLEEVRTGRPLADVAGSRAFQVDEAGPFTRMDFVPGVGTANAAIGAAFGLRPGQVSGVVESDGAVFIIESLSREDADREEWEQQKVFQRMQLMAELERDRWRQFIAALHERADIVDNRDEILRRGLDEEDVRPGIPSFF